MKKKLLSMLIAAILQLNFSGCQAGSDSGSMSAESAETSDALNEYYEQQWM